MLKKKTIIAYLCIVVILTANSFAAIVSDNDGSAFVTKIEFESMKENFADQVKQYEASIDGKIDGAIAAYLAGIKLSTNEVRPIITKDWGDYTILNGYIDNEYAYPDFNSNSTWLADNVNANFRKVWFCFAQLNYTRANTSNKRVLLTNIAPASTLDLSNATWAGIALNAKETFICSKVFRNNNLTSYGGSSPRYMNLVQCMNLELDGYYENLNQVSTCWDPKWVYSNAEGYRVGDYPLKAYANAASITYNEIGGKTFDYLHIGNWRGSTTWECSIKDCINYFKTSSNNSNRTAGWVSATTKSGQWSADDAGRQPGLGETWLNNQSVVFSNNTLGNPPTANDHTIPSIGLIGNRIAANSIYQYTSLLDGDGESVDRLTLENGMPLMKVKEDDKVEWEPQFSFVNVSGMTSQPEVKVVLSYKPFVDGIKTTTGTQDVKDYVKIDGYDRGVFPVTTSKKVKLKFEADKKGYIYVKFLPNISDSDLDSRFWEVRLDINNCGTYITTSTIME